MRVCVVNGLNIKDITALPECDVALLGFGAIGTVDYENELSGDSDKFEAVARLSKSANCAIACACVTTGRGIRRKSCAVAEGGKLLGICDMLHVLDDEDFKSGAHLGLFTLGGYKIGVCVENDLFFPEDFKALARCGCNAVLVAREQIEDGVPTVLIRAYSYLYGVPIAMSAGKTAFFSGSLGGVASSNESYALFESDCAKSYRLINTRTQGLRKIEGNY